MLEGGKEMASFEVVYVRPRLHGLVSFCWWSSFHVTEELAIVALGRFLLCPESHSTSRCSRASSPPKHWPTHSRCAASRTGHVCAPADCSGIIWSIARISSSRKIVGIIANFQHQMFLVAFRGLFLIAHWRVVGGNMVRPTTYIFHR